MATRAGVKIIADRTKKLTESLAALAGMQTLVGWPESSAGRSDDMNNPTLAYIHHHGAPEANIPARPALTIGIKSAQALINRRLQRAGKLALEGKQAQSLAQMQAMGMEVASHVRAAIAQGIPPPLKDSTLRGRIRKRKSGRKEAQAELASRAAGNPPGVALAKPLLFSGQLVKSVNYAIKTGKKP